MSVQESCAGVIGNADQLPRHARPAGFFSYSFACSIILGAIFVGSYILSPPHRAAGIPAPIEPSAPSWIIEGALTEACTCRVPCTCNFGEGPSPHDYCYALYSYEIKKGRYNDVTLDGLHFGATDLKSGRTIFIDEHANEIQREALRVIASRVILRAASDKAEESAKGLVKSIRYVSIKQEYDDRRNRLNVNGIGEFSADYIMGMDKTRPLVVRNNTTWRIHDAIKAKTSAFRVSVGKDSINTKNTNSNQGDFEYTDKMDFGSPMEWSCGSNSKMATNSKGEMMCGM